MCVCECVCVHWLWLNMFCGINSDHGWLLFSVIRPTGWLLGVTIWPNSSYDFHCAGFYPPVNQEQKNEKQELTVTGGRTPVLGVLPSILLSRQISSQMRRGHNRWPQDRSTLSTDIALQLVRWIQHHASYPGTSSDGSLQKGQGHLRLPPQPR